MAYTEPVFSEVSGSAHASEGDRADRISFDDEVFRRDTLDGGRVIILPRKIGIEQKV